MKRCGAVALALSLLAGTSPAWLIAPLPAEAQTTWVVTSLADDGGNGTLRYAIDNSEEGDTITFTPGLSGTITLDGGLGELVVEHALTVEGPGAGTISIDGDQQTRVLIIAVGDIVPIESIEDLLGSLEGMTGIERAADLLQLDPFQPPEFEAAVIVSGLTLRHGSVSTEPESIEDLFDAVGGNVLVLGSSAAFTDCVIEAGSAVGGGGIAAAGSLLSLEGCAIVENAAGGLSEDAPLSGGGGGLLTAVAYVAAERCTFEGNVAFGTEDGIGIGGGAVSLVSMWDFVACEIRDNIACDSVNLPGLGGGLVTLLSLSSFTTCAVVDNVAGGEGAGGMGGGVLSLFDLLLSVQRCDISGNSAGSGGGEAAGGGMFIGPSLMSAVILDSLIAGNSAGSEGTGFAAGGGIAAAMLDLGILDGFGVPQLTAYELMPEQASVLPLHLVNCTVSGNSVHASDIGMGGGLWVVGESTTGLSFCTVTDNSAGLGGGIATLMPGIEAQNLEPGQMLEGIVVLKNSIVAGNTALEIDGGDDILGRVESLWGNLIGDSDGWDYWQAAPSSPECNDLLGANPLLGPLTGNGGATLTHALKPGSPALDAACGCSAIGEYQIPWDDIYDIPWDDILVPTASAPEPGDSAGSEVESDQRGLLRPVDGDADSDARCDIGAYEAQPDIVIEGDSGRTVTGQNTAAGECTVLYVTVKNDGAAPLLIESIRLVGDDAGDYSLVSDPSGAVLNPGQSIRLALRFCPVSQGSKSITVQVYSNDPDEPAAEVEVAARALRDVRDETPVDPARLVCSYLMVDPAQVLPGQQVIVSSNVCNGGDERGSMTASLLVNGVAEQSQSVSVSGGACKEVRFALTRAVPGTYQIAVDGMQGQFIVLAPRTVQSSVASHQYTGLGTGGLIAIAAIIVALVAALVHIFRRD